MDAEHALPQPDFDVIASSFRVASEHLDRCRNLPAVDGGARLSGILETLLERFTGLERMVQRRFDDVDAKLDDLARRVRVA